MSRGLIPALVLALCFAVAPGLAETADHGVFPPSAITWKGGPPSLAAGAKFAVLEGDPKEGLFTMRLWLPDGFQSFSSWKTHWKVDAKRRCICSRSMGSDPRGPVVGGTPSVAQKCEKCGPSSISRLLRADGLGVQVRQDQPRIAPVRKAHVLRGQDGQGEVAVAPDELVGLGVAVRGGRLAGRTARAGLDTC
jgi:hypothetical protein